MLNDCSVREALDARSTAFVLPAVQGLLSRHSPQDRQGRVCGLANSLFAVARIFGVLAAFQLRGLAASLPFWSAAGLLVVSGAVLRRAALRRGSGSGTRSRAGPVCL